MAPIFTGSWFGFGRSAAGGASAGTPVSATGGTKTTPGDGYAYHVFDYPNSDTFDVSAGSGPLGVVEVAASGGGGAGGAGRSQTNGPGGAGGGGGAFVAYENVPVASGANWSIIAANRGSGQGGGGNDGGFTQVTNPNTPVNGWTIYGGEGGAYAQGEGNGGEGGLAGSAVPQFGTSVYNINGGDGEGSPSDRGGGAGGSIGGYGTVPGSYWGKPYIMAPGGPAPEPGQTNPGNAGNNYGGGGSGGGTKGDGGGNGNGGTGSYGRVVIRYKV